MILHPPDDRLRLAFQYLQIMTAVIVIVACQREILPEDVYKRQVQSEVGQYTSFQIVLPRNKINSGGNKNDTLGDMR